jgi:arginine/lysine/ornithine decarboxylase
MSKYNDLLDRLIEYTNSDFVPMHMPGAKRNETIYEGGEALSKLDITEIDGFDNLHNSEGILLDIKKKAQRLYNSKESLLLVNGSTAGILAAISGICNKNDSIIIARNCHVSVYNAIYINELDPEYIIPQMDENTGILKGITLNEVVNAVDKAIALNKRPRAVVITSPTYEGIVSEIKEIADHLMVYYDSHKEELES